MLEKVRDVRPTRLFIVADGPRTDHRDDQDRCEATRAVIKNGIDWDCEVHREYSDINLGCRRRIATGITAAFELVEQAIIVEDDCVPNADFFFFCDELLQRYANDNRVMAVSGNNFQGTAVPGGASYYFSRYMHCWGWATWRRAWRHFDADMQSWPMFRDHGTLRTVLDGDRLLCTYWRQLFDATFERRIDSWAYVWQYSCWAQSGLTVLPAVNLVENIGIGHETATHTRRKGEFRHCAPVGQLSWPLKHPTHLVRDYDADRRTDRKHFGLSGLNRWVQLARAWRSHMRRPA